MIIKSLTKPSTLMQVQVFTLFNFCPRSIRNNMALLQKEVSSCFV